ncbi:melanoma inhibitory activity protein 2 isoform X2 [Rhinoderma darwinii]|uniref:melanoma inhibitory activity protein 2 isoform X2 n=1 Tax=Rhinoderma darwinii TaxID=43563 RepID=UPI003F670C62
MAELRALVTLAVLLFTQIHSQKILSDRKKCGDPQCESMMMRVSAKQDYSGPDCRFLTFKPGDEINVYYKLTGRREDLWQGSKGKAYGFFPKDTVIIEEVFLSEEIEIPAQEIDFVCLDGGEYFFENEDSVLNNIKKKKPSDHILPEDTSTGGGHLPEESPDVTVQETPDPEAPDKESWGPSGIAGWFGLGKTNEKKETETDAENINKETVNEEAESEKQPGKSPPEKSGWLGGRLKKFLPFGEQRDEPQSMDNEANGEKASTPTQQTDQDQRNLNKDGEDSKSKWFNFGIKDVLGFGVKNEKKEETIENVDEIDNEMTPENPSPSQDRPVDSNPVPDQSDISGTEKVDKTKDIDVEDTTVTNAPEKGGSDDSTKQRIDVRLSLRDQEIISRISQKENTKSPKSSKNQESSPSQGTTLWFKSVVSNVLNLGNSHDSVQTQGKGEIEFGGAELSIQMFRHKLVSNDFNRDLDTLSQQSQLNGLGSIVDVHAKVEFNNLKEVHQPNIETFQDKGGEYEEKPRLEEEEGQSGKTSESTQADDSKEHVDKNIDVNEYSDTLSRETEVNGLLPEVRSVVVDQAKAEAHYLKEIHQLEVHPENTLTEDRTFRDEGGVYVKISRLKEGEQSTQCSDLGQVDDSRETIARNIDINEYSDTLSQGIVNGLKHGGGSVIIGEAESINLEEINQPKIFLEDKWTMEEIFNTTKVEEQDEDQFPTEQLSTMSDTQNLDDHNQKSPNTKTGEDPVEETSEELTIETMGSMERKDKPVCTTNVDHEESDERHRLTTGSVSTPDDESTNAPAHHESTIAPAHHESTIAPAHHESTITPAHHESTIAPAHHESTIAPAHHESTITPAHHESTIAPAHHESTIAPAHHESTIATAHNESTITPAHHESSITPAHHESTIAPAHHESTIAPVHHESTIAPVHHESTIVREQRSVVSASMGPEVNGEEKDAQGQGDTLGSADQVKGPTSPQPKSQENRENIGSGTDTPESSEEELSPHCDAEEAGTGGRCAITKSPHRPWKRPQESEENPRANVPIQPNPGGLPFTVMLRKISSRYTEVYSNYLTAVRSLVTRTISKVVSLLPDDLRPGADFYGCSWDVVVFTALLGFLSILMFTCRTVRCIKSRFYAGRECKLGDRVAEVLSSKREVLEKLSIVQKQYEDVQQTLQESGHQKLLTEISEQKALQESLQASNKELGENITKLEQDLEEEKQRGSELDNTLTELNETIKALEENFKKEKSQKEETRTTQKVFDINKVRLESSLQDAAEEQSHLEESIKQLSKEAEGWEERFSELSENTRLLSSSVGVMQEDMSSKQNQIKLLIDNLLSLKDWSSGLDEVYDEEDNDVLSSIKWDFENGEPLGDPQKQRIKKLIYAAMLNASLKSVESEKKHLCDNLSDEMKAKEQLTECITNLQNRSQSLSHEKGQLEEDVEKLKQKMSVMMEVYQENETKLHRKLTVQEKERSQKEAKLSKADEKMNMAASELFTVKTRVSELEEEMDKTASSYQNQVTSYEKKSHDNWLTARAAERYLSDVKKETAHLRQKLTEAEYKLELLEKDPFALDVIQAIGRENSPFGISPINRHPESRAFLSPPTLLEGPLRLSPMLPAADRGVRLPGYYPGYPGPKERGDVNSDRRADHQRTLSDAGSLSPPWDREQRNNIPPPGLPYPEPPFPPRRAERFYHYPPSGRFSGPAELTRNQGKPFMDSQDDRSSPEYKARINTSRNGEDEADNISAASNQDNEVTDGPPGEFPLHPPPPMRIPLLPPFFRRPFMPPPPMEMYGPPGYPGMPPPHIPMRSPLPPPLQHHYPVYPVHGEAYFPPQPIRPQTRNNPASDSAPPPSGPLPPHSGHLPPQDKLPEPTT